MAGEGHPESEKYWMLLKAGNSEKSHPGAMLVSDAYLFLGFAVGWVIGSFGVSVLWFVLIQPWLDRRERRASEKEMAEFDEMLEFP